MLAPEDVASFAAARHSRDLASMGEVELERWYWNLRVGRSRMETETKALEKG